MANAIIELKDVSLLLDENLVLSGVTLCIQRGESLGVTGRHGGGLTSFLKLCAGLLRPTGGSVCRNLPPAGAKARGAGAGFVFESGGLINNLTVFDNIALPLRYHTSLPEEEIAGKVRAALARLNISEYSDARPARLSLGTRKLASIARAIAMQPQIIYYDEPLLGLDRAAAQLAESVIQETRRQGVTSLLVSYDVELLKRVTDRTILIVDGRIVGVWPEDGANPEVRKFFS